MRPVLSAALLLCAAPAVAQEFPYQARVAADGLPVHAGPLADDYVTGTLPRGAAVTVVRHDPRRPGDGAGAGGGDQLRQTRLADDDPRHGRSRRGRDRHRGGVGTVLPGRQPGGRSPDDRTGPAEARPGGDGAGRRHAARRPRAGDVGADPLPAGRTPLGAAAVPRPGGRRRARRSGPRPLRRPDGPAGGRRPAARHRSRGLGSDRRGGRVRPGPGGRDRQRGGRDRLRRPPPAARLRRRPRC